MNTFKVTDGNTLVSSLKNGEKYFIATSGYQYSEYTMICVKDSVAYLFPVNLDSDSNCIVDIGFKVRIESLENMIREKSEDFVLFYPDHNVWDITELYVLMVDFSALDYNLETLTISKMEKEIGELGLKYCK